MKKLYSIVLLIVFNISAQVGHNLQGTDYSSEGVSAYAHFRHGLDGSLFLDPYFLSFLEGLDGLTFLDAGCGAGPWAIVAAKNGAHVYAIDIQENMIECAKKSAIDAGVADKIKFSVGSVAQLPYPNNFFDRSISINVGCNLPPDIFIEHFQELYRTLKPGGKVIITAPASFNIVFTKGDNYQIKDQIKDMLNDIKSYDSKYIMEKLSTLHSVLRATFFFNNGKLMLVEDEKQLTEGEPIWRKIPGLTVPNYYHSEHMYIKHLLDTGFTIERIDRPHFSSLQEWHERKIQLGKEYSYCYPFVIFHASKNHNYN